METAQTAASQHARADEAEKTADILQDIARETAKSTSIYDRIDDPMGAIEKIGTWLAKSRMIGVESPEQGMVVAMTCWDERITPIEFARRYHIIENRPSMRADYMHALFLDAGWQTKWIRYDAAGAQLEVSHPEKLPDGYRMPLHEFDAYVKNGTAIGKNSNVKANWKRSPRGMLKARAISEAVRLWEPGVVAGIYTPEEVGDMEPREHESGPGAQREIETDPEPRAATEPEGAISQAELDHAERVAKVVGSFASFGVVQTDLERLAASDLEGLRAGDDGTVLEPAAWTDEHFKAFGKARTKIRKALKEDPDEAQDLIAAMFGMEPGASG